jgi:hypothetical protein
MNRQYSDLLNTYHEASDGDLLNTWLITTPKIKMIENVKEDLELCAVPLDAPDLVIAHLLHFTLESHLFLLWAQQHNVIKQI